LIYYFFTKKTNMKTKEILDMVESMGLETNAAPMGTGKAAEGQELVPDEVFAKETLQIVPDHGTFLGALPGNHSKNGVRLPKVAKVPLIGDAGFFAAGSEKTTGAFAVTAGGTAPTGEVTITQAKYTMKIDVTDELDTFSAYPEQLKTALQQRVAQSMARTIEALIINADAETGATGNVNSDDGAPTAGTYYLNADHGIRELAINNTYTKSVGTLVVGSFADVMGVLGDFAGNPADCMWLFNRATYLKAMQLSDFADASKAGKAATTSTGALSNVFGSDLFVNRDVGKTEADGKISTTASNNTKGQFLYLWKPAVQFGFGKDLQMKMFDFGADGYQLHAWFYFGFGIYNKEAGGVDPSVAAGINVTL
jgi:hypothetical protein